MSFINRIFNKQEKSNSIPEIKESKKEIITPNTTPGLEELKSIFRRTYHDGRIFSSEIKSVGYHMTEETPWGSVIMERGEDKFIIGIHSDGISSLIYRNEKLNLSVDLVVEGKMTF